jgi:fermentation-respiration switch protein FrsA (DUF1100 family)
MSVLAVVAAVAAVAGAGYGAAILYMYGRQRALLYHGSPRRPELNPHELPGMREVVVRTEDGLDLLSWYAPPARGRRVLVLFHGNAGLLDERTEKLRLYLDSGLGVFALAWRGFSGNPGKPTEEGLYRDAEAAIARLAALGHGPEDLILYGESLGTAVATKIAAERPVAALILEAPPLSIVKMGQLRYPWLPVSRLVKDRFETDRRIGRVTCPILILHGRHDAVVPFSMGESLARLAPGRAELAAFDDGAHVDLHRYGAVERVMDFLVSRGVVEQT